MNEPEFPSDNRHGGHNGLDLRDYFAAKAISEMNWFPNMIEECAEKCYSIADAMLRARSKE